MAIDVRLNDAFHLRVSRSNKTYRPIRSEHQPLRAERIEHNIEIRLEIYSLPILPIGFRDHAGHLAIHIRIRCDLSHQRRPRLDLLRLDLRLRQMIDDKFLLRKFRNQFNRRRKLPRINQNIVGEPESLARCPTPRTKFRPRQKSIVGLRLRNVTHSTKLLKT